MSIRVRVTVEHWNHLGLDAGESLDMSMSAQAMDRDGDNPAYVVSQFRHATADAVQKLERALAATYPPIDPQEAGSTNYRALPTSEELRHR